MPTYYELWAKKTAKKCSFQTLPNVAVNIHPSAIFSLACYPPKSKHLGEGETTVQIHTNTHSHILNSSNKSLCIKLTERYVSMPDF